MVDHGRDIQFLNVEKAISVIQRVPMRNNILTTFNDHALVSNRGFTLSHSFPCIETHPGSQGVNLEVDAREVESIALLPFAEEFKGLDVIFIFGHDGNLLHRIIFGGNYPVELDEAFEPTPTAQPVLNQLQYYEKPIDLIGCKRILEGWDSHYFSWHLEQVKRDQGRSRLRALRLLEGKRSSKIPLKHLPCLFEAIQNGGIPFMRILCKGSWTHCDTSDVSKISTGDGYISVSSSLGAFLLDELSLAECWHTEICDQGVRVSLIELYSRCGENIAVFAPFKNFFLSQWLETTAQICRQS